MFRWLLQINVMISDLFIIICSYIVIQELGFLGIILSLLIWRANQEVGGLFFAWKPANIRAFLTNAKQLDL